MLRASEAVEPKTNNQLDRSSDPRAIRAGVGAMLLLVAFFGLAHLLQQWVLNRVLGDSLAVLSRVSTWMPAAAPVEGDWFPLFPFSPLAVPSPEENDGYNSVSVGSEARPAKPVVQSKRRSKPLPTNVVARRQLVLSWAKARLIPRGKSVPEQAGVPAGIELSGVGGLGIGLIDGDRLVSVAGVPVTDHSRVVAEVLAARGRRVESIVAGLVRSTAKGPVSFSVTVEQPYPGGETATSASMVSP